MGNALLGKHYLALYVNVTLRRSIYLHIAADQVHYFMANHTPSWQGPLSAR